MPPKTVPIKSNTEPANEIVLYQPDSTVQLEVRLENETVWLTQDQIALLFGTKRPAITKHLGNIFKSGELDEKVVSSILELTTIHGAIAGKMQIQQVKIYNLDAILSVGYRVNSINATKFRQWANRVLKEYLLKGYAVHQRFERIEQRMTETENKIDFFIKTSMPPIEGIFYEGQIFDAFVFVSNLIKSAKKSIVLIDNYTDESVLILLSKRANGVSASIYTVQILPQLKLDLQKHNAQYSPVEVKIFQKSHDRFLIIDDVVYHIGTSLKDLGKKWFAFSKMALKAEELLQKIIS
ncbi:DNA-binding protein [Fibrobacterales bacterium]|nr:DNA-binding protein [Fibrobacterales bacterium]